MSTIDRELVRAINSVRCFALIGSGPSCEIGLPSWHKLAETVISKLDPSSHQEYIDRCHRLLSQKDYPSVFSIIEEAIGMDALLGHVKNVFPSPQCNGTVYSYLDSWPFAVYLTTNYDDCLSEYLRRNNLSFPVRRNSKDDFRALRADSKGVIFKIHGDCSTPADIVLTQGQYNAFRKENERKYWREKIRSVLHMINVVLIGYSASDPDFRDQLEFAKDLASPDHPIFMFAADFQNDEIRRYYTEYNIRIIPYKNPDGTHLELHRVLKRYDPFIAKRGTPHLGQDPIDEDKANIASSIFLFTRLNLSDGPTSCLKKSYEALIAAEIEKSAQDGQVSLGDLQMALASRLHVTHLDPQALQEAIESLHGRGFVEVAPDQRHYSLSPSGQEALETTRAERKLREEKFAETIYNFLKNHKIYWSSLCYHVCDCENTVNPKKYGDFLCKIFDIWYSDLKFDIPSNNIFIDLFDSILYFCMNGVQTMCKFKSQCKSKIFIDSDGGVYSCSYFRSEKDLIGNLLSGNLFLMLNSNKMKEFRQRKCNVSYQCKLCKWKGICNGGCPKARIKDSADKERTYLCNAYKQFFEYTYKRFFKISESFKSQ